MQCHHLQLNACQAQELHYKTIKAWVFEKPTETPMLPTFFKMEIFTFIYTLSFPTLTFLLSCLSGEGKLIPR